MALTHPITTCNDRPGKTEKVVCDCGFLWSLAHQFTYFRLSDNVAENECKLADDAAIVY